MTTTTTSEKQNTPLVTMVILAADMRFRALLYGFAAILAHEGIAILLICRVVLPVVRPSHKHLDSARKRNEQLLQTQSTDTAHHAWHTTHSWHTSSKNTLCHQRMIYHIVVQRRRPPTMSQQYCHCTEQRCHNVQNHSVQHCTVMCLQRLTVVSGQSERHRHSRRTTHLESEECAGHVVPKQREGVVGDRVRLQGQHKSMCMETPWEQGSPTASFTVSSQLISFP